MKPNLVLVGGGHSHAIALKLWGIKPIQEVNLILISDVIDTPYSGMLPGHIAGFYTYRETHINLPKLTQFAQGEFILDKAIHLDLNNHQIIGQNHSVISFDYLSIDIGSTPNTETLKGFSEFIIPAKPVPQFLNTWEKIVENTQKNPHYPITLTLVGGGAGGVELALNIHTRLSKIISSELLRINLIHQGKRLLSNHNTWVSDRLTKILLERGIKLYLQEKVIQISSNSQVICQSGLILDSDHIFWITQAESPSWIKNSGLMTDSQGFILVEDTLQSVSHPHIFASGDIATMKNFNRPKAGVFAVRQGKPLFKNLQNIILEKPLKNYYPQVFYLALIGTGDRQAVASWGNFGCQSPLLWQWKDRIDRRFMQSFNN